LFFPVLCLVLLSAALTPRDEFANLHIQGNGNSSAAQQETKQQPKALDEDDDAPTMNENEVGDLLNEAASSMPTFGKPASSAQLPQVPDTMRQTDSPITDREKIEMEIIKSLIESYFNIVRKNFIDMVPKTIMYFLVNHVRDAMQNELVAELYRDVELPMLMKEADDVAQRRKTCVEMKDLLSMALEIVNEVRDFNTFK
jgi:dynamin 1-like protein